MELFASYVLKFLVVIGILTVFYAAGKYGWTSLYGTAKDDLTALKARVTALEALFKTSSPTVAPVPSATPQAGSSPPHA
jgi:hypothetical protein